MKNIFSSKTVWLAIIQAIIAGVVVFHTSFPDVGWLVMTKSVLDIALRLMTTEPVTLL